MAEVEPTVVAPAGFAPGTVVASNYRVVRRLGAGGMGTVYLGENTTLDQRVVIKVLQVGERGAGEQEARLLASLDHPNVVHVYAYDETWDCIVMQYLGGRSLYETFTDPACRLDLISSLRVVSLTAHALGAVHERGVVHRDVKPENIMLDFTGGEVKWVKLIDLGTALSVGRTVSQPAGTPDYCGPEQFDGSIGASPANDVYALGVTLFLLCSHRFPFSGTPAELGQAHRAAPVPDLAQVIKTARLETAREPLEPQLAFVVEQVAELVERMMAKAPAARPDAREVAWKLSGIVDNFCSERTHAGALFPSPIPLHTVVKTSTVVLPPLRQRAGQQASTQQALAALSRSNERHWHFAALGLALVMLAWGTWFLVSRVEGGSEVVPAVSAPELPPSPKVVSDAGVVGAAAKPGPELEPLDALPRLPPTPAEKTRPTMKKPTVAVGAGGVEDCEPDERWKRNSRLSLSELRGRAAGNSRTFELFEEREAELSREIARASTASQCAGVEASLKKLLQELTE